MKSSTFTISIVKKYYSLLFFIFSVAFSVQGQTVTYTSSDENFMNPDRGFYHPYDVHSSNFVHLDLNDLISRRTTAYTPWQGNYMVRTSMILRHYILDSFVNTDNLSQGFLDSLQVDFDIARQAGVKLIVRFSYTISPDVSCGASACPPYGDAPKSRVLSHISDLTDVLQNNSDIISVVQCGFIGVWGEHYYTDFFGDPSPNGDGKILNIYWQDRIDMLDALLDAVPANRMIQVRYPQMKQKYIYGITAPVTSAAMTASQAHNGSDISRIAFHNDCFLASSDDFGTYWDYGSDNTAPSDQTTILKPYAAAEGQFLAVGGETCSDTYNPQNNCPGAPTDMAALHFSFLNSDYNNLVNNDWEDGNCMDDIKRNLGYRFVMIYGTYPSTVTSGTTLDFDLNLENIGYAAPYNERTIQLVLQNTITGETHNLDISGTNTDIRFWSTGTIALNGSVLLPTNISEGDYALSLHLLDPSNNNSIADRPEYSIQLANLNTWDSNTGYNSLNHTIEVTTCNINDLVLSGNVTSSQAAETNGVITSNQNITGPISVSYDAPNCINLESGFSTDSQVDFEAFIDGCSNN